MVKSSPICFRYSRDFFSLAIFLRNNKAGIPFLSNVRFRLSITLLSYTLCAFSGEVITKKLYSSAALKFPLVSFSIKTPTMYSTRFSSDDKNKFFGKFYRVIINLFTFYK